MSIEKSILIISKDKKNRAEFKSLFKKARIPFEFMSSFEKAKAMLKKSAFNTLILDVDSYYEAPLKITRFIEKARQISSGVTILLASSASFLNLTVTFLKKGATFYIKKPIQEKELRAVIDNFDNRKKIIVKNEKLEEQIEVLNSKLSGITLVDSLTDCYNYRYLVRRLKEELVRAQRYLRGLSLVLIDIESLRDINERYGEEFGDTVIIQVAGLLKKNVRENDVLCRTGGGEFYVILPDTARIGVGKFCERVYDDLHRHKFGSKDKHFTIRVKMGIAVYPSEGINSVATFMKGCRKAIKVSRSKAREAFTFYSKKDNLKEKSDDPETLKNKLDALNQMVSQSLIDMIYGFAKTIEAKDSYTGKHVENTSAVAEEIAAKLKLIPSEIEDIKHAAILHDLGKIGVEEKILLKKGALTVKEMEKIKKHPLIAAQILKSIHALSGAVPAILHHHERYDGKGYPHGLKGDEIPLSARIIAVADVFQALTSDRPYRKAYSIEEAVEIIKKETGTHFDPKVVKAFLKILK